MVASSVLGARIEAVRRKTAVRKQHHSFIRFIGIGVFIFVAGHFVHGADQSQNSGKKQDKEDAEGHKPAPADGGLYMVINVSGGREAPEFPVTYLDSPPSEGWTDEHKTTKIVLRRIPAGTFTMGSPPDEMGRHLRETQHRVTLTRDFYIGIFEMTRKQYYTITSPTSLTSRPDWDMLPVIYTYYKFRGGEWPGDPEKYFMSFLRKKTGLLFDLPTEAHWEYACRAGTTRAYNDPTKNDGRGADCLTTGDGQDTNLEPLAWYYANSHDYRPNRYDEGVHDVGTRRPNAWGLYDMHGNASECCLDWYQSDLGPDAVTDPQGTDKGSGRFCPHVVRGGSWTDYAENCRSAYRDTYLLYYDYVNFLGFRITVPAGMKSDSQADISGSAALQISRLLAP